MDTYDNSFTNQNYYTWQNNNTKQILDYIFIDQKTAITSFRFLILDNPDEHFTDHLSLAISINTKSIISSTHSKQSKNKKTARIMFNTKKINDEQWNKFKQKTDLLLHQNTTSLNPTNSVKINTLWTVLKTTII